MPRRRGPKPSGAAELIHYRIIGGGPVALACALWLARGGVDTRRIALVQSRPGAGPAGEPAPTASPNKLALPRRIALSGGSCQLLERIIAMPAGGDIARIEVVQAAMPGRTRILASDFDLTRLGRVIAWPDLVAVLRAAAARRDLLPTIVGEPHPSSAAAGDAARHDESDDKRETVIIHAEGQPPGSDASAFNRRDFDQVALLTEVEADCSAEPAPASGQTAWECFGIDGPLALLPIATASPGSARMRYAVVWCDRQAAAEQRAHWPAEQLAAALEAAFSAIVRSPARPTGFTVIAPVVCAPLVRLSRRRIVSGREVWIGNAAQALHPVAGQGLNLGLRDAFELARLLAQGERLDGSARPEQQLAAYARGRAADRRITTGLTDLMAASFRWPLARPLQSMLLTALDLSPTMRRPLASTLLFGSR